MPAQGDGADYPAFFTTARAGYNSRRSLEACVQGEFEPTMREALAEMRRQVQLQDCNTRHRRERAVFCRTLYVFLQTIPILDILIYNMNFFHKYLQNGRYYIMELIALCINTL